MPLQLGEDAGKELNETFRLLDLPPELWSRICKLAVVRQNLIGVSSRSYAVRRSIQQPPITQVCRAIRQECLPHFYSGNVFYATIRQVDYHAGRDLKITQAWLKSIGGVNRDQLKKLYLCWDPWAAMHFPVVMGAKHRETSEQEKSDGDLVSRASNTPPWYVVRVLDANRVTEVS